MARPGRSSRATQAATNGAHPPVGVCLWLDSFGERKPMLWSRSPAASPPDPTARLSRFSLRPSGFFAAPRTSWAKNTGGSCRSGLDIRRACFAGRVCLDRRLGRCAPAPSVLATTRRGSVDLGAWPPVWVLNRVSGPTASGPPGSFRTPPFFRCPFGSLRALRCRTQGRRRSGGRSMQLITKKFA